MTARRDVSPETTIERFGAVGREIGITRVADVTGLDVVGIPVCLAIRPTARSLVTSVGKGMTLAAAKAGALMESIETWHAEHLALETDLVSSREMVEAGRRPIDILALPAAIDGAVDESDRRAWVAGRDLRDGGVVWVPEEIVSMNFTADALGPPSLARNSNGLASGNNALEAIRHGLCEVIERDAEARWRTSAESRRIDLDTVHDDVCGELLDRIRAAGLYAAAWDVTADNGIPCYGCVVLARPNADAWLGIGVHDGFCCRPSSSSALAGALLEAVQKRLTYISGSRDDLSRAELDRVRDPELVRAVWAEVTREPAVVPVPGHHGPDGPADADIDRMLAALGGGGHQVVTVDLTRPDWRVPVVKVVVTGLEGPYGAARPVRT